MRAYRTGKGDNRQHSWGACVTIFIQYAPSYSTASTPVGGWLLGGQRAGEQQTAGRRAGNLRYGRMGRGDTGDGRGTIVDAGRTQT
jgi:hypothetical protein